MTMTTTTITTQILLRGHCNRTLCHFPRRLNTTAAVPFYGAPRPSTTQHPRDGVVPALSSVGQRFGWTCQAARTAIRDPTRADAVAAVGELTGYHALSNYLVPELQRHPTGRQVLRDRPIVSRATIPYEQLLQQAREWQQQPKQQQADKQSTLTFGQAYGLFLLQHGFDPDERDEIQHLPCDSDEAYVMLRYRQCHDFFHALTGLPPTVPGELGLKWLELFQTRLPMTALACTAGSLTLSWSDCDVVYNTYLPWARRCHHCMQHQEQSSNNDGGEIAGGGCTLLNVYYEREWDTPLDELRNRLGLIPAPVVE